MEIICFQFESDWLWKDLLCRVIMRSRNEFGMTFILTKIEWITLKMF
jgi:hypothetical protein